MSIGEMIFLGAYIFIIAAHIYLGVYVIKTNWNGLTKLDESYIWMKLYPKTPDAEKLKDFHVRVQDTMERKRTGLRNAMATGAFISAFGLIMFLLYLMWGNKLLPLIGLLCYFLSVPLGWCVSFILRFIRWLRKRKKIKNIR